jgi:hypothetical protein
MDQRKHKVGRQMVAPVYSLKSIRESEKYMHQSFEDVCEVDEGEEGCGD